ncbi:LOW QUALITY PROTEIN: hypothetical protein MXB_2390 [Myxobolus squamalis]|nr:LOW QUALITY PROTEIN: hypothetical protein MXB_2390 [Myxobolus squamalis]
MKALAIINSNIINNSITELKNQTGLISNKWLAYFKKVWLTRFFPFW